MGHWMVGVGYHWVVRCGSLGWEVWVNGCEVWVTGWREEGNWVVVGCGSFCSGVWVTGLWVTGWWGAGHQVVECGVAG